MTIPKNFTLMIAVSLILFFITIPAFAAIDPATQTKKQNRDMVMDLIVSGRFDEANIFLDAWEKSNPEEKIGIDLLREIQKKVKLEPDEQKRKELILKTTMEQIQGSLSSFSSQMQGLKNASLDALNNKKPAAKIEPKLSAVDQALYEAIPQGDVIKVKELINKGADVNAVDPIIHKPLLIHAISSNKEEVALALLEAKANPNAGGAGFSDTPPLYFAINQRAPNIVRSLIKHGANVNQELSLGGSLLMKAVNIGNLEIIKALVDAKADLNVWDLNNYTPLMRVVELGNTELVALFIEHGAKTTMRNSDGLTAMDIAKKSGNQQVIDVLNKYEGKVQ